MERIVQITLLYANETPMPSWILVATYALNPTNIIGKYQKKQQKQQQTNTIIKNGIVRSSIKCIHTTNGKCMNERELV